MRIKYVKLFVEFCSFCFVLLKSTRGPHW